MSVGALPMPIAPGDRDGRLVEALRGHAARAAEQLVTTYQGRAHQRG